jgi:acyl-CoA reductase-like NAD-dependent aldehyde dehydrogenase
MTDSMAIINPASEALIQEMETNDFAAVAQKVTKARQAQPFWAARSLSDRIEILKKFRDLLIHQAEPLAATLTAETGKPIAQAKSEILATPSRIDFFVENVAQAIASERVYHEHSNTGELEEIILCTGQKTSN